MGSSPVVGVMSRVTSRLTSYDVRIFRNFGLLPKCQQAKRKPMKIGEERTPKRGEEHSPGTQCEWCYDGCRSSVCRSVKQTLLKFQIFMKHGHDVRYSFVNITVISIAIMSSATMH